jgi:hypothetical protein
MHMGERIFGFTNEGSGAPEAKINTTSALRVRFDEEQDAYLHQQCKEIR